MPWNQLAVVATFPTLEEAHLAKNLLEVHGITSILDDKVSHGSEHVTGHGVHLLVHAEKTLLVRNLLPNKARLVETPAHVAQFTQPSEPQRADHVGLDPGFDAPRGPSLTAIVLLLTLAMVLALTWIAVTIFFVR